MKMKEISGVGGYHLQGTESKEHKTAIIKLLEEPFIRTNENYT